MKYSIRANEIKGNERQQGENASHLRGFATLIIGNDFKISNIAILESNEGKLFVSMPRYKSSDKDEKGANVYKDVCNPITKEFREELYDNILEAFEKAKCADKTEEVKSQEGTEMPSFSVSVTPFEREGSNIRGLARIYFEDCFIVNNVSILQGKEESLFIAMPSYRTKQVDENQKPVYQDVCYPITKEFREKLYVEIVNEYEQAKEKNQNQTRENAEKQAESTEKQQEKEATPFR